MKRDMDLVRQILFAMEKDETQIIFGESNPVKVDGYKRENIDYHMKIMAQAGLLHEDLFEISSDPNLPKIYVSDYSISWLGHEFLDAARDNKRWEKVKDVMSQVGGFVFDVGKQLLIQYLKSELKLP